MSFLEIDPSLTGPGNIVAAVNTKSGTTFTLGVIGDLIGMPTAIDVDVDQRNTQIIINETPFKYRRPTLVEVANAKNPNLGITVGNTNYYRTIFNYWLETCATRLGIPKQEITMINGGDSFHSIYPQRSASLKLQVASDAYLLDPDKDTQFDFTISYPF